jgi:hypothetical protein
MCPLMNPWNLADFTQKQIQDENVRLGEARCANESRAKSEAKFVAAWNKLHSCAFVIEDLSYQIPLPAGKTRADFMKHVLQFFAAAG